ncbi:MAG: thioredoxin-dependent thiol peroxidase [Rhodospirillales bacterium]|nr:thioredoxin-dependent thiol peroxidase [Rhodospirillales bacterium]
MSIDVGDTVQKFKVSADGGETVASTDLKGQKTVLYFYPKDDTSGCTLEAQNFRDAAKAFAKAKTRVIGVSKDSVASHDKFKAKYDLNFPLLSDDAGKICEAFGVWVKKSMYGREYMGIERATFLIDAKGVVRNVWHKVKVPGHVEEVLAAAQAL